VDNEKAASSAPGCVIYLPDIDEKQNVVTMARQVHESISIRRRSETIAKGQGQRYDSEKLVLFVD
jgi:hypothetical protein